MARLKIDFIPNLKRIDLSVKGLVNTRFMGNYASAFKGNGLEFANYREYTQNDDASRIDWKASSRAKQLLVKEFVEERNLNVHFLLDVSSKMVMGSSKKLKCEYAAELISSLAYTVLKTGDFVGLTMFSDKITKQVLPQTGLKQFHLVLDALSNLSYYYGGSNIGNVLRYAFDTFEERSLVILISDFINHDDFSKELKLVSKKFDFIGFMIRDPIDVKLPDIKNQVLLEDPLTGERILVTPKKFKKLYEEEVSKEIRSLRRMFKDSGADFLELYTNDSFIKNLVEFFNRRKLRWK